MTSPFPGMDPYIEPRWLDFHTQIIVKARSMLQRQLNGDLVAGVEERVVVEDAIGTARRMGPDVRVIEVGPAASWGSGVAGASAGVVTLEELAEPIAQRFIEIRDLTSGGRIVTVIEFTSPTNKLPGEGQIKYQQKQDDCVSAGVNLVEVDLSRVGRRKLLCHRWARSRLHDSTYNASVWKAAFAGVVKMFAMPLDRALPTIPVPLRRIDDDITLALQTLVDECYADARYDRTARYDQPLDPPLEADEQAIADELLRSAGLR